MNTTVGAVANVSEALTTVAATVAQVATTIGAFEKNTVLL